VKAEENPLKLYINVLSPNVRRVRLTAAVLGLELEEVALDLSKGEHKTPDYLALNPNGSVPLLVDGDFVLSESRAIMQYLASLRPASGLLPADERARAQVTRWQFWDASHFSPQVGTLAFQRVMKQRFGMGEPDAAKVDEALSNLTRFVNVLNQHLQNRSYVVGEALTLADLTLASTLMYGEQAAVPLDDAPHVRAWFSRISALEAWRKTSPWP
jgi:glutathione S-transferase